MSKIRIFIGVNDMGLDYKEANLSNSNLIYFYYYIQMQIVTFLYRIPDKLCEESIQI